jgi:hypothetical protein
MFEGITNKIAESVVPPIVVGAIAKYKGEGCRNLKLAIALDTDIFQLWVNNARDEGIYDLETARHYAGMAPDAKNLLTMSNIRKWLMQEGQCDIVRVIDDTPGGNDWLERILERFKEGLWG